MDLERFRGKKIALLGFGVENVSVARFFLKHDIDFEIRDQAPTKKLLIEGQKLIEDKNLKIRTGKDYLSDLNKFDIIIRSPGVPYLKPEIQRVKSAGSEVTSSTKLFFDWCPAKIIGVTGTKGKGTTASLIYEIAKRKIQDTRYNNQTNSKLQIPNSKQQSSNPAIQQWNKAYLVGNIGVASLDIIEEVKPENLVVFELSSFQLQDLEISPHIAVVTNSTEDHLNYHQTLEEYRSTKQNILKYQSQNDSAVLNKADLAFKDGDWVTIKTDNKSSLHLQAVILNILNRSN